MSKIYAKYLKIQEQILTNYIPSKKNSQWAEDISDA